MKKNKSNKFKDNLYLILLGINLLLVGSLYLLASKLTFELMIIIMVYVFVSTPVYMYLNYKKAKGSSR